MDLVSIAVVAAGLLAFSLVSARFDSKMVTPPMIFIIFGLFIGSSGLGIARVDPGHGVIHVIAELTLILILFSDAARIDLRQLVRDHNLPVRMLLIGMSLTILLGAFAAVQLFPEFALWEAALLAALLAPTDAALGQAVISAREIPVRIRQTINVESGINDGIALPAVLLFAALASMQQEATDAGEWLRFAVLQLSLGPLVGVATGYFGARLLDVAAERGWAKPPFQGIGILSLALLTYALAQLVGGNGFIAAFVCGAVFGNAIKHPCTFLFEFMETEGQLLMLITFMIFGAALIPEALPHISLMTVLYAVLSLTLIRMLPVAISLIGSGVSLPTTLFLGWFGPRGLASILFVLLILEKSNITHREEILTITVTTVALSALLHGLSAAPLARVYSGLVGRMGECAENQPVGEIALREGHLFQPGGNDPASALSEKVKPR